MTELLCLAAWAFVLVFGSLLLCIVIASAYVSAECAEQERGALSEIRPDSPDFQKTAEKEGLDALDPSERAAKV